MSRWTLKRWFLWMVILAALLAGVMGISVSLGAVTIPLSKSWVHSGAPIPGAFRCREMDGKRFVDHPRPAASADSFRRSGGFCPSHGRVRSPGPVAESPGRPLCPGDLQRGGRGRRAGDPLWVGGQLFWGPTRSRGRPSAELSSPWFLVYFIARVEGRAPTNTMLLPESS